MMYSYIKLPDETQFAYSDIQEDNTIEVSVERPREMGFDTARCLLPAHRWLDVEGFGADEMARIDAMVKNNAPLIWRLAREASKEHA